jgi:CheY-like chemotaxis protein
MARKSVLEELGYNITTAVNGQEALELFSRGVFDLVITDYKMPKMNGIELIKSVRALAADVPIILISGYAEALGMTESNTGADAVIAKSANEVAHLVRSVNRLMRHATPKKPPASHSARTKAKRHGSG